MGAWAADTFGNDTACDWSCDLEDEDDLTFVEETLETVIEEDDYLDSDEACEALAACEVIARLKGNWGVRNAYTEPVDAWVQAHPLKPSAELIALAIAAIERILGEESELRELWEETGDQEWFEAVKDLRRRVTN